jgi:formiminotetrahydrofolate cyclodeaminase
VDEYLTRLASAEPVPGGGSAAMIVAAAACALVAMVARIAGNGELAQRADALRARAIEQSRRDERAFARVMQTRGDERQAALTEAAEVPLEGMQIALDALHLSANALALGNVNLVSDAGCAAEFAHAGLLGCAYNVKINHRFMRDAAKVAAQRATLERYEREATSLASSLRKAVNEALQSKSKNG